MSISTKKAQRSFDEYTNQQHCGAYDRCYTKEECSKKCELLKKFIVDYPILSKEYKSICLK